ncbi:MAG: carboxymuconolactone decarboxylase family protein [Gemmatimonadaceae bacterium]
MPDSYETPRVPLAAPDDVTDHGARAELETFVRERGKAPNLFRAASVRPEIMRTLAAHLRAVTGPGEVPSLLKELVSLRVSLINDCAYCLASHTVLATRLGATSDVLRAVTEVRYDGLDPSWRAALRFADAITPTRGDASDAQYAELERHWSAAQIVEITAVAALFNYFNRFANALHIPVTR